VEGLEGVLVPLALLISSPVPPPPPPAPGIPTASGTAGTPFLVAIPLGFNPEVIISLCTLLGGGGVLIDVGLPFPIPICIDPGTGEFLIFEFEFELFEMEEPSSDPFQGK
jgi:hypothetical protein